MKKELVADFQVVMVPCPPEHLSAWRAGILAWWKLVSESEQENRQSITDETKKSQPAESLHEPSSENDEYFI